MNRQGEGWDHVRNDKYGEGVEFQAWSKLLLSCSSFANNSTVSECFEGRVCMCTGHKSEELLKE